MNSNLVYRPRNNRPNSKKCYFDECAEKVFMTNGRKYLCEQHFNEIRKRSRMNNDQTVTIQGKN